MKQAISLAIFVTLWCVALWMALAVIVVNLTGCSTTSVTTPSGYRFNTTHSFTDREIGRVRVVPTTQGISVEIDDINSKSNARQAIDLLKAIR